MNSLPENSAARTFC